MNWGSSFMVSPPSCVGRDRWTGGVASWHVLSSLLCVCGGGGGLDWWVASCTHDYSLKMSNIIPNFSLKLSLNTSLRIDR